MPKTIYDKKWKVVDCFTDQECWCRLIVLSEGKPDKDGAYEEEDCVIGYGEIETKLAKHIVWLHNKSLEK